jgi:hypothetical protein
LGRLRDLAESVGNSVSTFKGSRCFEKHTLFPLTSLESADTREPVDNAKIEGDMVWETSGACSTSVEAVQLSEVVDGEREVRLNEEKEEGSGRGRTGAGESMRASLRLLWRWGGY